jgi:Flp pilus assembly protein TadD
MFELVKWLRLSVAGIGLFVAASCAALETGQVANNNNNDSSDPSASSGTVTGDFLVARVAGSDRDAKVAAARYGHALSADPENLSLVERAFIFSVAAGEMENARRYSETLVAKRPEAPLAQLVLGINQMKANNFAAARAHFEKASASGNGMTSGMLTAWAISGQGQPKEALAALKKVPTSEENAQFLSYHQALIADQGGLVEEAKAAYEKAAEGDGGPNIRVAQAYASFLARQGKMKEAADLLGERDQHPADNPAIIAARQQLASGKAPTSPVETPQQGVAEALYGLAGALISDRGVDLPIVYLQMALDARPDFDIGATLLGELYEAAEKNDEAKTAYGRVKSSSPYYTTAQVEVARLLAGEKKQDDAIRLLERHTNGAQSFEALVALGDVYRSSEKWTDAAGAYGKAAALIQKPDRRDWGVYYAQGIALERAKDWKRAEAAFVKALELHPEQPLVMNYLGYTWIEQGTNLDKAKTMIEKAVELRPTDGFIIDSLGWAHFRMGDFENAVKYLEQAVLLEPGDPTINDHLGDAYWRVGRQREARFQWSHALTFKPAEDQVPVLQAKLNRGLEQAAQLAPASATP